MAYISLVVAVWLTDRLDKQTQRQGQTLRGLSYTRKKEAMIVSLVYRRTLSRIALGAIAPQMD